VAWIWLVAAAMPKTPKPSPKRGAKSSFPNKQKQAVRVSAPAAESIGTVLSTVSSPSTSVLTQAAVKTLDGAPKQKLATQKVGAQLAAAAMPANPLKAGEHGLEHGHAPEAGQPVPPHDPLDTASTVTESLSSQKVGKGVPPSGFNPGNQSLDRVRVDSGGRALTTNMGTQVGDNQNSLKAGLRGPTLMEDFILREKITHFDHERIPERIVHARGSGAHGYFEAYDSLKSVTRAAPFAAKGKKTPVFVRFSTVAGERGSFDLARDVRGFAVKFYTDEGNWDIVGNNIPVFFIQDAMKFPDLVHAVKPEPHHAMPQAASAHDTFWDFVSLMPESAHMLMWVMSDRAIPRSYRMMQGFGVHTFRLINEAGESRFCKFHWTPVAGTHSVVWDEAVKINGADPDFHRRDLWETIEAGVFPEWELGLQIFTEAQAEKFSFDVLDATKLVPEEVVPVQPVGRMVLNRNPDNFFAETEQVAFGTMNLIPGIDTSNDPLLQGRHHSYFDTQLSRLGGPNFHELPINAPVAQVHNNQRDGMHRQSIARGRVAYEPNLLGGGCPFQAGLRGFTSFPAPVQDDKVRGKPEKFADHFTQARLFWKSQTPVEQNHIVGAYRFELTKVQPHAIRERVLSMLMNVDGELAQCVADGLGIELPAAQERVLEKPAKPEVESSPSLSLFKRPGELGAKTRHVALLVADGIDADSLRAMHASLVKAGAVPRFLGVRLGQVQPSSGAPIHVEASLEIAPSVLWDAVVIPANDQALAELGQAIEFVKDQYRHCKTILALGDESALFAAAALPLSLPDGGDDPGLLLGEPSKFLAALGKHRHFARESDPPRV
jgi:catalase